MVPLELQTAALAALVALDLLSLKWLWELRGESPTDHTARALASEAEERAAEAMHRVRLIEGRGDDSGAD